MSILNEIASYTAMRVYEDKRLYSQEELEAKCAALIREKPVAESDGLFRFGQVLAKPGIRLISEVKKASPSKGVISEDFPYLRIALDYEAAGADCISCLTEPKWFQGSDDVFAAIRARVGLPMLRKDFVVEEYQLYQAKTLGADAVLLICALLDTETIRYYLEICRKLQMDVLVETHDETEIASALAAGARIIGVNNRNLKDFSVDFGNAAALRKRIPEHCLFVAESGVQTPEDVRALEAIGADAVLVGEALMRAADKKAMIAAMKRPGDTAAETVTEAADDVPAAAGGRTDDVSQAQDAAGQTGMESKARSEAELRKDARGAEPSTEPAVSTDGCSEAGKTAGGFFRRLFRK